MSATRNAKTAIMAGALVATGIVEVLEGIEQGMSPISAVVNAFEKTKARGKAIKKASQELKT